MIIKEILGKSVQYLKDKGFETPRLDAEMLLGAATGLQRIDLYSRFERPLEDGEVTKMRSLLQRRSQGEPIAYILGEKEFYRKNFLVSPATLIPRPETELLVEHVLDCIEQAPESAEPLWILDLGIGTGCIAQSVLAEVPRAQAIGVEISEAALMIAKQNSERIGVGDRYHTVLGAAEMAVEAVSKILATAGPQAAFDFILANPPYVAVEDEVQTSVKKYEPHQALFSDQRGLSHLMAWSTTYAPLLSKGGTMMMEMGKDHGDFMKNHFVQIGIFAEVHILKDYAGWDRFIEGVRHG